MRFAIVDLSNLFYRARYGATADPDTKAGLALLIIFRSLRKLHRELKVQHIVFAVDQGSWRYAVYPAYKSRRKLERMALTAHQQAEQQVFNTAFAALTRYLAEKTRCSVLAAADIEGDDFIARWIARHPDDEHIIVSSDSDFVQLVADNVRIYDAINQRMISVDQVTDEHGQRMAFIASPKDGKIKVGEPQADFVPEAEWWRKALFIKLLRGDVGDTVFSAYPGVRYAGKKCSIEAAWQDRIERGYDWNNLMFQSWDKLLESGAVQRVRVIDEFGINQHLIDLTMQPETVIKAMDQCIDATIHAPVIPQVGMHFLRFCAAHDLPALAKEANDHVAYLNEPYQ